MSTESSHPRLPRTQFSVEWETGVAVLTIPRLIHILAL